MMDWDDEYEDSLEDEEEFDDDDDSMENIDWNEDSGSAISESGYKIRKMESKQLKLENKYVEEIAKVIGEGNDDDDTTTTFFAEDEFRSTDIKIEVDSIGRLSFPITENCVKKLISISSKAHFGKGEKTVLDENVRDTHEIPGKKLKVTINQKSFTKSLDNVKAAMKLASNCVLKTELHNMLIYSPGQFFKLHQDSEKATNMVGTLVVILPSPHIGGDLVIQHGSKEHTFASEHLATKNFKCVYFYADCMHKIETVRQGYRIALTYKLISQPLENASSQVASQSLKIAVQNYFSNFTANSPAKLVFFLDHSYTEHSLKWHLLKGQDQLNGNALKLVGKELGLIPYLVLVDIHHMWYNGWDHQMARIVDVELNDVEYELSHFIDSNNEKSKLPFKKYSVSHSEICWTKETSASFKPEGSNCDGFTGNEGLNLDYWYKRAGVVLWPLDSELQIKFLENKKSNLSELRVKISSPGKEDEVKETVKICGKFLCEGNIKSDFDFLVEIALYIKDEDLSLSLLSDFKWSILNVDISESLFKIESHYGVDWCIDLLSKWKVNPEDRYSIYGKIFEKINDFVESYLRCGGSPKIVEMILEEQIDKNFTEKIEDEYGWKTPEKLLTERMEKAYKFFLSCALSQNSLLVEKVLKCIVDSLTSLYPVSNLTELYLKLKSETSSSNLVACEPLKAYLQTKLSSEVAKGIKAKNDWSIEENLRCGCKICLSVNNFLHSKDKKKELKVTHKVGDHIKSELIKMNLPVDVSVEDDSIPKKLTMTKKDTLHKDARKRYAVMKSYLKQLQ